MALQEAIATSPDPIEPMLGVKQAAYLLGISVKTLRDWTQNRKIEYVKVGKFVKIHPDTIRRFLRDNRRPPVNE